MDKQYNIYQAPEDQIPNEDKARLDGYLFGRSEASELERMKKEMETKFNKLNTFENK
jgi:hypothetical protein